MVKSHLDHAGNDLRGKKLDKDLDYTDADFSGADGRGVDFAGLTLRNANFTGAKLTGANFTRAKLTGAKFNNAVLKGADFTGVSVDTKVSSQLNSSIKPVDFSNAQLQGATFTRAILCHVNFTRAHAELPSWWRVVVIVASGLVCLVSGFTSAIATTFVLHYCFLTPRQTLPVPDQKPSTFLSLFIGIWSIVLITVIRTLINNVWKPEYVAWHVYLAISLILLSVVFAVILIDEAKTNVDSLIGIVLVALSPLVIFMLTKTFASGETEFASSFPFVADHVVKGLGGDEAIGKTFSWLFRVGNGIVEKPTEGRWVSGIIGAAIGAVFGCWFSRVAISGDDRFAWLWKAFVEFTTIRNTNFERANLTGAIFNSATLQGVSFKKAVIAKVRWDDAKCLDCTYVGNSYLKYPQIRYLVVRRSWEDQDYDGTKPKGINLNNLEIEGINLEGANLQSASFIGTNLAQANLRGATLTDANLKKASLEGSDLKRATLTGACIQAWTIDEATELDDIVCEYIYLKDTPDPKTDDRERIPDASSGVEFESGDFESLFKKDTLTIQLFVRSRDDRRALTKAFQTLIEDTRSVFQGFEMVGSNALVKIKVSPGTNKSAATSKFYQTLEQEKPQLLGDETQNSQAQEPLNKFLALTIFNVTVNTHISDKIGQFNQNMSVTSMSENYSNNLQGANIANMANVVKDNARQQANQYNYPEQKASIVDTAAEIQRLLKQLEETNPSATESEQIAYINIATKPDFKERAINALKEGGEEAIDQFVSENKYLKVLKAVIKGWWQSGG